MKRLIYTLIALAAFAGCQITTTEIDYPEENQGPVWYFVSEKPAFDDATKTAWTGDKVEWVAGDQIRVACYNSNSHKWLSSTGELNNEAKCYSSNALAEENIVDGVASFVFAPNSQFAMTGEDANYRFYSFYPNKLNGNSSNMTSDGLIGDASISNAQTISSTSFNVGTDILVGISADSYTSKPYGGDGKTAISLLWKRVVAFPVITFKNLNGAVSGEKVNSVKLTAQEGAALTGAVDVNIYDGTIAASQNKTIYNYVSATSDTGFALDGNGSFTTWFTTLPFTATSLSVEVVTDKATYTRDIDLSSNNKQFVVNKRNLLTINMASAVRTAKGDDDPTEETIVITESSLNNPGTTGSPVYGQYSWSNNGINGVANCASANNIDYLQFNYSSSGSSNFRNQQAVYNTVAVPGNIRSIKMTTASGTNRTWYAYVGKAALTNTNYSSSTSLGSKTISEEGTKFDVEGDGYTYFYLNYTTGSASYISEIVITYEPAEIVPTPSIEAEGTLTIPYVETTSGINVIWTAMEDCDMNLFSDENCTIAFSGDWFTADLDDDNNIDYHAFANAGNSERVVYIQLYGLDGDANDHTKVVKVTQSGAPILYNITVNPTTNGTVTPSKTQASAGETITLTVTPDSGYTLATLTYNGADIASTKSFVMPAEDVTVNATFIEKVTETETLTSSEIIAHFTNDKMAYGTGETYVDGDITWTVFGYTDNKDRPWMQLKKDEGVYVKISAPSAISEVRLTITSASNTSGGITDISKHSAFSGTARLKSADAAGDGITSDICSSNSISNNTVVLTVPTPANNVVYVKVSVGARIWGIEVDY